MYVWKKRQKELEPGEEKMYLLPNHMYIRAHGGGRSTIELREIYVGGSVSEEDMGEVSAM